MKKFGILNQNARTVLALVLCLALLSTCFAFLVPLFATKVSADGGTPVNVSISSQIDVTDGSNISVNREVKYGQSFEVPAGATVIGPDKQQATVTDNKVVALQMGTYKVSVSKNDITYDYYVNVTLDEEYFLKVDFDGADIPSYVATGDDFNIPMAKVVYYDKDKILREYPQDAYTITVADSRGTTYYNNVLRSAATEAKKFTDTTTTGKVFLTYTATLGAANGKKTYTKTFEINVQSTVPKMGNPTLTVSGVQKDVSVNRPVTLPKATATDPIDTKVKVEIKVTDPDNEPVKTVDIDEDGYAYRDPAKGADYYTNVDFDNDEAMTFYPIKTGTYTVTYTAYNDAWKGTGTTGKSSDRTYYITCSDLVAPVFKKVEEYNIPATWGLNVYKYSESAEGNKVIDAEQGGKITFTVPEVVDNKDHMYPEDRPEGEAKDTDLISVYFRITDADNSKTIVTFQNILAADDNADCKFKPNDEYDKDNKGVEGSDIIFNKDHPFTFDFNKYNKLNKDGEPAELAGTYTVLFRARDKANNTSSKTYTINLQTDYTDNALPTTAEVDVAEYLSASDKTFTVPYPAYADALDSRPFLVYRIYTDATLAQGEVRYIDVKGGEIADIEYDKAADKYYFIIDKDKDYQKKLVIGDTLYFYVGVKDKVGNFKSNAKDGAADLYAVADADIDTPDGDGKKPYEYVDAAMKALFTKPATFTYTSRMTVANEDTDKSATVVAGDSVVLGGFDITTANADMRYYTGFEVGVYSPAGDPLNVTLETLSIPGDTAADPATIIVRNITFTASVPAVDGDSYKVVVRVYDVNGNSKVYGYTVEGVQKSSNSHVKPAAVQTIGTTGNAYVAYKLHEVVDTVLGNEDDVCYIVRKIEGGVFGVMGNEFIAKTQGSYSVQEGYIFKDDLDTTGGNITFSFKNDVKFNGVSNGTYNFEINDSAAPVIEVQGQMPTYWAKYDSSNDAETKVQLPVVVAYTDNSIVDVKTTVTFDNNTDVDFDEATRTFKGTKDGVYTVKYTATSANSQMAEYTAKISVGDVEGPAFTVTGGTSANATLTIGEDEFKFGTIVLDKEEDGVTITKKLIDPSHEVVADATVSGSATETNLKKTNNGSSIKPTMSGDYTVEYTAKDSVGNEVKYSYTITVMSDGSSSPTLWTPLSTVLIIVAIVLLAGVIIYVVRFRKVKK